jgi:hypothetical protein
MNSAIEKLSNDFNVEIPEFTVAGVKHENLFAHNWYIGINGESKLDADTARKVIDDYLKEINDDYKVEREAALKNIEVKIIHSSRFIDWLKSKGKEGGQNKFPRVLNEQQLRDWDEFISR